MQPIASKFRSLSPTAVLLFQNLWLSSVWLLVCCDKCVIGMLALSPMMVAPVCHVGDPLQLTCTASVEFTSWSILRGNEQGTFEKITNDVILNSRDPDQTIQTRVDSIVVTFTRTSSQGASPLTTTLSIDSVNRDLNGTIVRCIRMDVENPMTSASTTIQIINSNLSIPTPILSVSEEYGPVNVTVNTVELAQQASVRYYASVVPVVPITSTGSTRYQLTILYNTIYNFSVVAASPCWPNATVFITLKYANCGHPESLFSVSNDSGYRHSVPKVVGYDGLSVEGSAITFSCPPGLELTGPNSTTCAENGEWKPDPRGLFCNDSSSNSDSEVRIAPSPAQCTDNALVAAVLSTVFIFLVISALTFVIGFMSGLFVGRKSKKESSNGTPHVTAEYPCQVPVYDYVQMSVAAANQQEQTLKLNENVAYQPSKTIAVKIN